LAASKDRQTGTPSQKRAQMVYWQDIAPAVHPLSGRENLHQAKPNLG
jgi:hypothetical protein